MENINNNNVLQDVFKILDEVISSNQTSLRLALVGWVRYVIAPHKGLQLDIIDVQDLTEMRRCCKHAFGSDSGI